MKPHFRILIAWALLTACESSASNLKVFPSISKHRDYFLRLLSKDLYPIWYANGRPVDSASYYGNQISYDIKASLVTGKSLPEKYTPGYIFFHLLTIAKYSSPEGRHLVRESEMLDLVLEAYKLKDEGAKIHAREAVSEYLHPTLKLRERAKILKGFNIKKTDLDKIAGLKLPLSPEEKAAVLADPEKYAPYTRLVAGEEAASERVKKEFREAQDFSKITFSVKLVSLLDTNSAAVELYKRINDPIYDTKDTTGSRRHVRTLIIAALGAVFPDSKMFNQEYELMVQYGEAYKGASQRRTIELPDITEYLGRITSWGQERFGISPNYPLEPGAFIERVSFPAEKKLYTEEERRKLAWRLKDTIQGYDKIGNQTHGHFGDSVRLKPFRVEGKK